MLHTIYVWLIGKISRDLHLREIIDQGINFSMEVLTEYIMCGLSWRVSRYNHTFNELHVQNLRNRNEVARGCSSLITISFMFGGN
jgi:hypothetical protein